MYWSKWGMDSCILRAGMDGKNNTVLVSKDLELPNSLSIDYANERLYWIDAKAKVIESVRLDGTDRKVYFTFLHRTLEQCSSEGR